MDCIENSLKPELNYRRNNLPFTGNRHMFVSDLCRGFKRNNCILFSFLMGLDTRGIFSAIGYKGDNFYNFLFAFLHVIPL